MLKSVLQYNTIKRWADYLVGNALQSENQYVLLWLEAGDGIVLMKTPQDKSGWERRGLDEHCSEGHYWCEGDG